VVISGHHESDDGSVSVMADSNPGLLFDYNGFPPESYQYKLPNPGNPELAQRIQALLTAAHIPNQAEEGRGHDHGVFVPLLGLDIPQRPDLPIVSVSLRGPAAFRTQGPDKQLTELHWALGRALGPLREEGVLILGSGNTHHGRSTRAEAAEFDANLHRLAQSDETGLKQWEGHPAARKCHGRSGCPAPPPSPTPHRGKNLPPCHCVPYCCTHIPRNSP
jgi:aromatic ring-opening dioxygenase catalytic subunit (LigB family)